MSIWDDLIGGVTDYQLKNIEDFASGIYEENRKTRALKQSYADALTQCQRQNAVIEDLTIKLKALESNTREERVEVNKKLAQLRRIQEQVNAVAISQVFGVECAQVITRQFSGTKQWVASSDARAIPLPATEVAIKLKGELQALFIAKVYAVKYFFLQGAELPIEEQKSIASLSNLASMYGAVICSDVYVLPVTLSTFKEMINAGTQNQFFLPLTLMFCTDEFIKAREQAVSQLPKEGTGKRKSDVVEASEHPMPTYMIGAEKHGDLIFSDAPKTIGEDEEQPKFKLIEVDITQGYDNVIELDSDEVFKTWSDAIKNPAPLRANFDTLRNQMSVGSSGATFGGSLKPGRQPRMPPGSLVGRETFEKFCRHGGYVPYEIPHKDYDDFVLIPGGWNDKKAKKLGPAYFGENPGLLQSIKR